VLWLEALASWTANLSWPSDQGWCWGLCHSSLGAVMCAVCILCYASLGAVMCAACILCHAYPGPQLCTVFILCHAYLGAVMCAACILCHAYLGAVMCAVCILCHAYLDAVMCAVCILRLGQMTHLKILVPGRGRPTNCPTTNSVPNQSLSYCSTIHRCTNNAPVPKPLLTFTGA